MRNLVRKFKNKDIIEDPDVQYIKDLERVLLPSKSDTKMK